MVFVAVLLASGMAWAGEEEKPLSNAEVIKLTKASLGDAVILALVKSAKEVKFDLRTEELIRLTEAGVSKSVLAAMIERAGQRGAAAEAAGPKIVLRAAGVESELAPVDGDVKTIVAPFVGMRRFVVFAEVASKVRTRDRRPSLLAAIDKDPRKGWWYVKLDQDKDKEDMNRSLDAESPGMWGGTMSSAPDDDYKINCDVVEERPGLWRFTPRKDLKPGEYGLYFGKGETISTLYDFGVDK
jgi:hypothetical protein